MRAYFKNRSKISPKQALAAVSRETEDKLLASLPDRTNIPATDEMKERFIKILDNKIATAKGGCGHLRSQPTQTWHIFMWDDIWRCNECLLRFSVSRRNRGPLLSPMEENTCDYCRRYSPTYLKQTVSRVGQFVLYGAACRRCGREFESGGESVGEAQ